MAITEEVLGVEVTMEGMEVEEGNDGGYDGAMAEEEVAGQKAELWSMALEKVAGGGDMKAGRFLQQTET